MKRSLFLVGGLALVLGCRDGAPRRHSVTIELVAESDPGARLPAVNVRVDGRPVGATGADGSLQIDLRGESGRLVRIEHDCPPGYLPPPQAKQLRLRPLGSLGDSEAVALQVTLGCRPEKRLAVFVIRARNGSHLPVKLDGTLVAETSSTGVAHLFLSDAPGSEHSIEIDSTEQPLLMPRSPSHHFTIPDSHEIFVVNQTFEAQRAAARRRARRAKIRKIE